MRFPSRATAAHDANFHTTYINAYILAICPSFCPYLQSKYQNRAQKYKKICVYQNNFVILHDFFAKERNNKQNTSI